MPTTINPSGQTITQYDALVGTASNLIANVGPGSAGQILQSAGNAANPAYSTSTYPTTNAVSTLLYASSANVMGALATANSGVLATGATGIPSIDTTNFAVLSTGLQLKGNNTNTAPPAGFIGQQIRSAATAVSLSNTVPANITSIDITTGIWDVSALGYAIFAGASGTAIQLALSTNTGSFTGVTAGDNSVIASAAGLVTNLAASIPSFRVTLSSTTTYYLVIQANFTSSTCTADGRLSATRVG